MHCTLELWFGFLFYYVLVKQLNETTGKKNKTVCKTIVARIAELAIVYINY